MARRRDRHAIDSELELVRMQVADRLQKEENYQQIINKLTIMMDEVTEERKILETRRDVLIAEKEPINWLPTELLIQIFTELIGNEAHTTSYKPALLISHTCAKWRAISLGTPRLWARLVLHGYRRLESKLGQLYLERSKGAPLELYFHSIPNTIPAHECFQTAALFAKSQSHFVRLETLSLHALSATSLIYLLPYLSNHPNTFPRLQRLTLAITTPNPTFMEAQAFLDRETSAMKKLKARGSPEIVAGRPSRLLHLKLEQVPLFSIPVTFISNLRSLELTYSPRKRSVHSRHHYYLKMTAFYEFLALTPLLEELILTNTVPCFDITLPLQGSATESADAGTFAVPPIKLDFLKSIDWTYPSPSDVHRFFSLIDAPLLERLDLWVDSEERRARRHDPLTVYPVAPPPEQYHTRNAMCYPSLRELTLQCDGEDTTVSVLRRKFIVPALQKVEFASFDTATRPAPDARSLLPTFPRLESIFRDPRLLNLTHLTLSRFTISGDPGRVDALLGYMPVLTFLSFDSCSGLGRLLEGLQETVVGATKDGAVGARSRRGVKVCPRLDTLSFWDCQDVDCASLRAAILSRNRSTPAFDDDCIHRTEPPPNGETEGVTREALGEIVDTGHKTQEAHLGRKIKPLRKRRCRPELAATSDGAGDVLSTIATTIIAMEESFQPAHISFVRVENCSLMGKDEVLALRDLGVVDVIWAGSG